MDSQWDVVVVGAGPAGATSAALLARAGLNVCVLDRARFPRHKACAEYLSPGVLEMLAQLGLEDALTDAPLHPVPGMDIVSAAGTTFRLAYSSGGRARMAASLPRFHLDARLVSAAAGAGAHVYEGVTAHAPLVEEGKVCGIQASTGGKRADFRAPLTVVADGSRSTLARQLGLALPAKWPSRLGLVAHFEGVESFDGGYGQMHVGRSGYCGVAPMRDGRANVAMVVHSDALRRSRLPAARFFHDWIQSMPRLRELLGDAKPITPVRGVAPVGARSRRAWTGGALLAGDAASFFDPFTGEGIYRALRGAELVAGAACRALEDGDVRAAALAPYGDARRSAFRTKSAVTLLVQLFVQYPRLMEYGLPRLANRELPALALGRVLGDIADPMEFLKPRTLWAALRP